MIQKQNTAVKYFANRLGPDRMHSQLRCGLSMRPKSFEKDFVTEQMAVLYVFSGSGIYSDEAGCKYNFDKGCAITRIPNLKHCLRFTEESEVAYIAVPAEIYAIVQLTSTINRPVFQSSANPELIRSAHHNIYKKLADKNEHNLFAVIIHMQEFIALLCEEKPEDEISRASQMLNRDATFRSNLQEIAAELNMSYSLFRKKFTAATGVSPGKYQIARRMESASTMLLSGMSVGEVAEKLEYPDIYTFSRQFKKYTGKTPSQLKNSGY